MCNKAFIGAGIAGLVSRCKRRDYVELKRGIPYLKSEFVSYTLIHQVVSNIEDCIDAHPQLHHIGITFSKSASTVFMHKGESGELLYHSQGAR